jgi:hypothetical protein
MISLRSIISVASCLVPLAVQPAAAADSLDWLRAQQQQYQLDRMRDTLDNIQSEQQYQRARPSLRSGQPQPAPRFDYPSRRFAPTNPRLDDEE